MKYVVTSEKSEGDMTFRYNDKGMIIFFQNNMVHPLTDAQLKFLTVNFPFLEANIENLSQGTIKVVKMEDDLTFDDFYNHYGHKVGKKDAERAWNKLSKADQLKAYLYVQRYNTHLVKNPGIGKMYPERYLHAQRWNDHT